MRGSRVDVVRNRTLSGLTEPSITCRAIRALGLVCAVPLVHVIIPYVVVTSGKTSGYPIVHHW